MEGRNDSGADRLRAGGLGVEFGVSETPRQKTGAECEAGLVNGAIVASFFLMNLPHSFLRFVPVIGQLGLAVGAGFLIFALL